MKTSTWLKDIRLVFANLFLRILLDRFQYCHVRNNRTGVVTLHEGPKRVWLGLFGELLSDVQQKIVVQDGQFAVVYNPYDPAIHDIREGEHDVRTGPVTFSLHPGERLGSEGVQDVHVLTDDDALLVRARKEAPHPTQPDHLIPAGTEVLVRGFHRYVPHKDIEIVEEQTSVSLSKEEGVYVQNNDTGEVRLVRGETDLFLEQNESLWSKNLTQDEQEALGFVPQKISTDTRILAASPRPRRKNSDAVVIDLEDHQAICLHSGEQSRVVFGPAVVFLEPHERPRILHLSGGVPVRPNALKVAVLDLGPDFILDKLQGVRTRDNACLTLAVNFHWQFKVDREAAQKLFALKDPIGFAVEVLSSEIREIAAGHNFEEFHSKAASLIKEAVFGGQNVRHFEENGFEVFGIDVESIVPEDREIQAKLAEGIKANVDVFTHRVREEAQLESERRLIEGRRKNEEARKVLIELQVTNERLVALEAAKTKRQALLETAQGEAEALKVKADAEREAETKRLTAVAEALAGTGGERYLALEQSRVLRSTDKVVVPTDARIRLTLPDLTANQNRLE